MDTIDLQNFIPAGETLANVLIETERGTYTKTDIANIAKAVVGAETAATSVASGDYIRLKNAAGNPILITRDNFLAAIRDALGGSLTESTKLTHIIGMESATGAAKKTTAANLASALAVQSALKRSGNVGVCSIESNYFRFRQADQAASYASTAIGAWVRCPDGKILIVAKNEAAKQWASANVAGGGAYLGREAASKDFDGKSKTNAILSHFNSDPATLCPAAYYCNTYAPTNVDWANVGAGKWWLPSAGELFTIYAHKYEINAVLAAIGGTVLAETWYWSSTESSATGAWGLIFSNGNFYTYYGVNDYRVRPVSAFV